jgi:hypothetical protein
MHKVLLLGQALQVRHRKPPKIKKIVPRQRSIRGVERLGGGCTAGWSEVHIILLLGALGALQAGGKEPLKMKQKKEGFKKGVLTLKSTNTEQDIKPTKNQTK